LERLDDGIAAPARGQLEQLRFDAREALDLSALT
jgi:hypothetical protein